jgi:hypothetical protein
MTTRTTGLQLLLLLCPAATAWLAGLADAVPFLGLGTLLAVRLGVRARPAAAFAILLPVLYLAAAVTAHSTNAVVALMVAMAAAVGAAASLGLQRGLISLLAAALLGSFSQAGTSEVLAASGWLLAGSLYGWLLVATLLRRVSLPAPRVDAPAALGYALLLACLTLVAWFAARGGDFAHPWWLPLVAVAVSEPLPEPTAPRALRRLLLAAIASMVLVFVTDVFETHTGRALLLLPMLAAGLAASRRGAPVAVVFLAPVLVLMSGQPASHEPPMEYLLDCLAAFIPVLLVSSAGHWAYWMLQPVARPVEPRVEPGSA